MRTSESTIRQRILFPDAEVRATALAYFCSSQCQDETLMPLVIQAIEQYGRDTGFHLLWEAVNLPQTEATIRWLTDELAKDWYLDDVNIDNYRTAAAMVLCHARVDLLRSEMADLPAFPEELKTRFLERLEMAAWDWDTGWAALEQLGRETHEAEDFSQHELRRLDRIVEALGRHPEKIAIPLALIQGDYPEAEAGWIEWLHGTLVELVGAMRLPEAIPILLDQLHDRDFFFNDSYIKALRWIGGDDVVRAIAEDWANAGATVRQCGVQVLEDIHTELSAEKCFEWFTAERNPHTQEFLAHALLANFVEEAIEPIQRALLANRWTLDPKDLKRRLVATCAVMGKTFPEYEAWHEECVADQWGNAGLSRMRIRRTYREDESFDDLEDFGYVGVYDSDRQPAKEYIPEPYEPPPRPEPIRREELRIGRNDPCPCGSGKKYKKCCLGKDLKAK